jgi:hypothetical protein
MGQKDNGNTCLNAIKQNAKFESAELSEKEYRVFK